MPGKGGKGQLHWPTFPENIYPQKSLPVAENRTHLNAPCRESGPSHPLCDASLPEMMQEEAQIGDKRHSEDYEASRCPKNAALPG